jgi:hypothetical protein
MQKYELPCYTLFTKKCWDVKCYHSSIRFQQNYVPRSLPKNSDHCCCMFQMICLGENAKSPCTHPNQVMPPAPAVCRCSNHPISFRQSIPPVFNWFRLLLYNFVPIPMSYQGLSNVPFVQFTNSTLFAAGKQVSVVMPSMLWLYSRRCCGSIHSPTPD